MNSCLPRSRLFISTSMQCKLMMFPPSPPPDPSILVWTSSPRTPLFCVGYYQFFGYISYHSDWLQFGYLSKWIPSYQWSITKGCNLQFSPPVLFIWKAHGAGNRQGEKIRAFKMSCSGRKKRSSLQTTRRRTTECWGKEQLGVEPLAM